MSIKVGIEIRSRLNCVVWMELKASWLKFKVGIAAIKAGPGPLSWYAAYQVNNAKI